MTSYSKKNIRWFALLCSSIFSILLLSLTTACWASPLSQTEIKANYQNDKHEKAMFELAPATANDPLPHGTKAIKISSAGGNISFGKILFNHPDLYHYTVRRIGAGSTKDIKYDNSTYYIEIAALSNGDIVQVITASNKKNKCQAISYHDQSKQALTSKHTKKTHSPQTGIIMNYQLVIALISIIGCAAFIIFRQKYEKAKIKED